MGDTLYIIAFIAFAIFCIIDVIMNIREIRKAKERKEQIQYLETLRDWCANTGLHPDEYLKGIATLKNEIKSVKGIAGAKRKR